MSTVNCEPLLITVVMISSNCLVRLGVQQLLESAKHIRLVGHAHSGAKLEELVGRERPQVLLIDVETALDLAALVGRVRNTAPNTKVVALIGWEVMDRVREAVVSELDGIVLRVQPPAVLISMIEGLCRTLDSEDGNHESMVSHLVPSGGVESCNGTPASTIAWPAELTERERSIIALVGRGLSNKEIAAALCISDITVRHHLTNSFDKVGVASRQKLLIHSHQCGFLESHCPD